MTQSDSVHSYFPGLDGLRAVSVLIVFFAHVGFGHIVPGGFGVTVFFFLSGFLITSLLIREYDTYGHIAILAFYQRRLIRLLPPLLVTLVLAGLLLWWGYAQGSLSPWTLLSQIFFFYNYYSLAENAEPSIRGLNVLWSLSVEEQFYLIFPFFFIVLARSLWQIPATILVIVLALVWRVIRFEVLGHDFYDIYISTDTRIDSILYGCLLALINAHYPNIGRFIIRWRYVALAAALALLIVSFVWRDVTFRATLRYSLQGLALMPIFHLAVHQPQSWLFSWLNWRPVRRLGQYSYTFYLAHMFIIQMLIFNGIDQHNIALLVPVAFALSVAYSAFVFRVFERPFKPLRARLTGHT